MSMDLTGLVSVLENEIVVGEALYCNVEAEKKSIVLCDIENLLEQIEAREPWLRSLSQLEEKRSEILRRISSTNAATTVRLSLGSTSTHHCRLESDFRRRMRWKSKQPPRS
jgi:flagellar biosynthesis/type III secretory pathway chaperone